MKAGATVRLVQPVIEGVVQERRVNPTSDEIEVLVEWTDSEGQMVQRWFDEGQLQEVQT